MIGKELMYGEAYLYWKEFGFYKQKIENELETKKLYSDATLVEADKLRKTLKEIEKYQDEISKEVSATYNQNRSEAEQMKNYGMIDTELLRLEIFEWRDLDFILKKFMEVWIL
jgi:predicted ATP-grasp superfamily ATP-dependent carboligase